MKKSKIAVLALCGVLSCGGIAGGAYALYSGMSTVSENTFTVKAGKLNETDASKVGVIIEDKWDAENANNLAPNQVVKKNPKFKSNAEYEAWCVMKVEVPVVAMKVDSDSQHVAHDAVLLNEVDTTNWKSLKSVVSTAVGKNSVYYYGYKTALNKGDTTTECFKSIKVPNITDLPANFSDTVDVSAMIIQKVGYDTIDDAFKAMNLN